MVLPLVSIIVPVLNTHLYVEQCLDSLLSQTLREIEVICVDNGSTDGSFDLLTKYARSYPNVLALQHPHGRQGGARNAGIGLAKGEFIGFVDSDDFVSTSMFEKLYCAGIRRRADIVVCNFQVFFDKDDFGSLGLPLDLLSVEEAFSVGKRPKLLRNLTIWNKLYSRRLITNHSLSFPISVFHEDQFFAVAAYLSAKRIACIPEALYYYRKMRPGSVNEYRGPDCMHLFQVMEKTTRFVECSGVQTSTKALLVETKALKYMELFETSGRAFKREFFQRMKSELKGVEIGLPPRILSRPERRKFLVAQRCGYNTFRLFLMLRRIYAYLRTLASGQHAARPVFPRTSEGLKRG